MPLNVKNPVVGRGLKILGTPTGTYRLKVFSAGVAPAGYTISLGTKSPVFGASGQSPFPASGWTSLVTSSQDDAFQTVSLPFTWNLNGTGYTSFYPGSNCYITFGAGSTNYGGLSASNPALDKIHIASSDSSWQRVSIYESGTDYKRLRFEGTDGTGGTPGSPTQVYEITFFNPALTGGNPWFELLVGLQGRGTTGAISGIYSSSALLTGGGLGPTNQGVSPNESYVCVGDATGTTWTVYTGYSVGGTDY